MEGGGCAEAARRRGGDEGLAWGNTGVQLQPGGGFSWHMTLEPWWLQRASSDLAGARNGCRDYEASVSNPWCSLLRPSPKLWPMRDLQKRKRRYYQ